MKLPTVVALEQALALPYATLRMAQLGWRVIRVESPASDPNRRIGKSSAVPTAAPTSWARTWARRP